jgi:hypothetical protein
MSREILTSSIPEATPAEQYREDEEEYSMMGIASNAETSEVYSVRLWASRRYAPGILQRRPFRHAF